MQHYSAEKWEIKVTKLVSKLKLIWGSLVIISMSFGSHPKTMPVFQKYAVI